MEKPMQKYAKLYLALLVLPLFLFVSACSDDDSTTNPTPNVNEAELLVQSLEGTNGGYLNNECPAIVTAQNVYEDLNGAKKFYLVDVRAKADYDKGHVAGAVNVLPADILTHMASVNMANYDKVAIICYSGQTAAWLTAICRMSGYSKVFSMKYGMSSWHADFDKITPNISSQYVGVFTDAVTNKAAAGALPTLTTGKTVGADILKDRVAAVLAEGFSKSTIAAATVMTDPSQYYIVNYWPATDYSTLKHINGAIQYSPKADLKLATFLKTLPTNKTIVVYCYTGQTSANVVAILRAMGYDAKSLLYGVNAMIWQTMKDGNKNPWNATNDCMNFAYVK